MFMMKPTHFLIVVLNLVNLGSCNQMDPHVWPSKGPYFEGWYMRIIDFTQGISVGWIFNNILPEISTETSSINDIQCSRSSQTYLDSNSSSVDNKQGNNSCRIMITHLVSSSHTSKLIATYDLLPLEDFTVTKNGHPIVKNPDDQSPAEFEAKMGELIDFVVRPHGTTFSIKVGEATLRGETMSPVPWGPHGEGPEGWIEKLPLPLHWFVYSLRSDVIKYEYINNKTGQVIKGGSQRNKPVVAHLEKNWGGAFPEAWIWAEGVNPDNNASFACSSGIIHEVVVDLKAELSGYKNPDKGIVCHFHPLNSVHVLDQDGCAGYAKLKAEGLGCVVHFDISVDPNLLSSCLITPQVTGYKLACVESYNAVANITVYQRHGLHMILTDSQIFKMAAVEFGGAFMCQGKCPS